MKQLIVFGAGKSSVYLIDYLIKQAETYKWKVRVADFDLNNALAKVGSSDYADALQVNVSDPEERASIIESADIVISLLPPSLHILIAEDCIRYRKNLLTASYADSQMLSLEQKIEDAGLLFLCEMGLDPGIDHMSAMRMIDIIQKQGGVITMFRSHCGGLVAPESDDNPWHYKISWNPRNVVMAGKAGATFLENGKMRRMEYEELFDSSRIVQVPGLDMFSWYPNRDSLHYIDIYKLGNISTFIRTTLRYPDFNFGWKNIIELKLTDEEPRYLTDGMTLAGFFEQHFKLHGFSEWVGRQLTSKFEQTKQLLEKLRELLEAEEQAGSEASGAFEDFMMVNDSGDLKKVNMDDVKTRAAATVANQMHEANTAMKQLFHLGMGDDVTVINKGLCSAMDVLQFALEKKLALHPDDKDMVVMMHEIGYLQNNENHYAQSYMMVKGKDAVHTAMAKTVGLPLGIAAKLILQGKLTTKGLCIPTIPEIYEPVLKELEENGIKFEENFNL